MTHTSDIEMDEATGVPVETFKVLATLISEKAGEIVAKKVADKAARNLRDQQKREAKKAVAIEITSAEVDAGCVKLGFERPEGLDVDDGGNVKDTYFNCRKLLGMNAITWGASYNLLSETHVFRGEVPWDVGIFKRELSDNLVLRLRDMLLDFLGVEFTKGDIRDALQAICYLRPFHPVREYLDGLEWDGIDRIGNWNSYDDDHGQESAAVGWLTSYAKADDSKYVRAAGLLWLVAAVRRVRQPGCKFDCILVPEGDQGTAKGKMFRILGGEFFSEHPGDIVGRYAGQGLFGAWICLVTEMALRGTDEEKKKFLQLTEDKYMPMWGGGYVTRPRQCVFAGDSNRDDYLNDPTGARRYWPVACGRIDLESFERDRDQIWAQAAHLEATDMSITLDESLWAVAAVEQAARYVEHPWEEELRIYVDGLDKVHASELYEELGFTEVKERTKALAKEVRITMKRLGFKASKSVRLGDKVSTGFERIVVAQLPPTTSELPK